MDIRRTLITVGVLGGALALLVWGYRFVEAPEAPETKPEQETTLGEAYGVDASAVHEIRLEYADPGLPDLLLAREDDGWMLHRPFDARLQGAKVDGLLRVFDRRIRKRLIQATQSYGFDRPQVTFSVTAGDAERTFLFGARGVSYSLYVKELSDDAPILMESWALDDLITTPNDLRDRHLLHFQPADVREVHLQRRKPGWPITVDREGPAEPWRMTAPIATDADTWRVNEAVRTIAGIGVSDVLADNVTDLSPWQLDDPPLTVQFGLDDGTEYLLRISERPTREDRIIVTLDGSGSVYALPSGFLETLPTDAFDWRDRHVAKFQRIDTTRIDVDVADDTSYVLARRRTDGESVWYLTQPRAMPADGAYVDQVLYDLDALEATRIVSADGPGAPTYGLRRPQLTLRVHDRRSEDEPLTIRFGREMGDGVAVQASEAENVAFVPTAALDAWLGGPSAFRSKHPCEFDPERVRRLELRRSGDVLAFARQGAGWRVAEPIVESIAEAVVAQILEDVREMRVERFLPTAPYPSDSGLDSPSLTVSLLFPEFSWLPVRFGRTETGLVYGEIDGDPDVFQVPESAVRALNVRLQDIRTATQ